MPVTEFRANAGSGWTDEFKLDIDLAPAAKRKSPTLTMTLARSPARWAMARLPMTVRQTCTAAPNLTAVYIHYRNVLGAWELLDSVTAGADGRWEYETDRLVPGTYEFQAGRSSTRDANGKPFGLQIVAPGSVAPEIAMAGMMWAKSPVR